MRSLTDSERRDIVAALQRQAEVSRMVALETQTTGGSRELAARSKDLATLAAEIDHAHDVTLH